MDVNVLGVMHTCKASLPLMKKTGGGTIALCSSVYGLRATPALIPYITSKHAVEGLKESLAAELIGDNIRVNNLNPSFTPSEMTGPFSAGCATHACTTWLGRWAGCWSLLGNPLAPAALAHHHCHASVYCLLRTCRPRLRHACVPPAAQLRSNALLPSAVPVSTPPSSQHNTYIAVVVW